MGFLALLVFFVSYAALGQTLEIVGPPADPGTIMQPVCEVVERVFMNWEWAAKIGGIFVAAIAFLRPFSNVLLKVALALTAMANPAAQTAGKVIWVLGTISAAPALGTPSVMQKVYSGAVTAPVKNPLKKKAA